MLLPTSIGGSIGSVFCPHLADLRLFPQFMMTPNQVKFYNMNGTPVNRFYWQKAY